jgi:hypothetical protein
MYMKQAEAARESIEPSDTLAKFLLGFKPSLSRKSSSVHAHRRTSPQMFEADEQMLSRRAMIAGSVGSVFGAVSSPALAGLLPAGRVTFPPVDIKDVVFDKEKLATFEVQKAIAEIAGDLFLLESLAEKFEKDPNFNLVPTLDQYLNVGRVRFQCNKVVFAYDEAAQDTFSLKERTTLQSLQTLATVSKIEKGKETRSKKRLQLITSEFGNALRTLTSLVEYLPLAGEDYTPTGPKLRFDGEKMVEEEPPKKAEEPPKEEPPKEEPPQKE